MSGSVEIDTSALTRGMARLSDGLTSSGTAGARAQAEQTAGKVRGRVPRRTGRLAATVTVVGDRDGWGVTYGGSLPYADYIEHRSNAVADGIDGADESFARSMHAVAEKEARRL